ncbi:MAG: DEAD/DEAH box helicase [Flavobacteriaceae bacterium]|nr:DEAD/DEAH box helicase [Flavobacteriaceae bacterium]
MERVVKSQQKILQKLGIEKLNPMQEEAKLAISSYGDVVILSPTGSGKTLSFLLPIIAELDPNCTNVQTLIITPSRELAIQIEQVTKELGSGYKTNVVYGGRPFSKDKIDLKHTPTILIGTPGRIADHLRRDTFSTKDIKTIILDEFDKSLEIGFESEMRAIIDGLPNIEKRILTSATQEVAIPRFVGLTNPLTIDYLDEGVAKLEVQTILSSTKDKLEALITLLHHLGNKPGIIFCNYKDTIKRVSDYLNDHDIAHGCFYGGLEQKDRERALIKFRNGTHQLLIATDLAARGIDVPEIKFIIHYHLPLKAQEFTHRNGRTARMNNQGTAYVLQWEKEDTPDFIEALNTDSYIANELTQYNQPTADKWETIFISGGRKDKISKGDIAGLFCKQGKLTRDELGMIEIKPDCAFVAVKASKTKELISLTNNSRLKKKKVRISVI